MAIFRVEKNKNYTTMSNYHLKEKDMSLKAIGLLSKMLSLPDDWDYSLAGLVSICKENETAIKSTLDELKRFGYLEMIKKFPNETNTGRIEYEYIIYEQPKQEGKKQALENLPLEFQPIENQVQLNTKELNTNKETILDKSNIDNVGKSKKEKYNYKEEIKYIIDYLNQTAGTRFTTNSKNTQKLIKARFNDGYKIDDFYDVIDNKWKEWKGTEFQKYMQPSTLFAESHFDNYLNSKSTFTGKAKISYGSKPSFDNTANHDVPKAVVSMNKSERQEFENTLAKDENGNFLKF